jgi:hypothetical protein
MSYLDDRGRWDQPLVPVHIVASAVSHTPSAHALSVWVHPVFVATHVAGVVSGGIPGEESRIQGLQGNPRLRKTNKVFTISNQHTENKLL